MRNPKRTMTAEQVREYFHYEPETGQFTRIKASQPHNKLGPVGYVQSSANGRRGYVVVKFFRIVYTCHRLAWLYVHGEWPKYGIDHINGDAADNRLVNLRDIPQWQNTQNLTKTINRFGNLLGTSQGKDGKWRSSIRTSGKTTQLGTFLTMQEAHTAYIEAKRKFHVANTL